MQFRFSYTDSQKDDQQYFQNSYSIQSFEVQENYLQSSYQDGEQSQFLMQSDQFQYYPDNIMQPQCDALKNNEYEQYNNDQIKFDQNQYINDHAENQNDIYNDYTNTPLFQSSAQESFNVYPCQQKWVSGEDQNMCSNQNVDEQQMQYNTQVQQNKQFDSNLQIQQNNYSNTYFQNHIHQCPDEKLLICKHQPYDGYGKQSVGEQMQEQIFFNQEFTDTKERKQKNHKFNKEIQKQNPFVTQISSNSLEKQLTQNDEIQIQKPFIQQLADVQQQQSSIIIQKYQNQEEIQFDKQQIKAVFEVIKSIRMQEEIAEQISPTSYSFSPRLKDNHNIPLQERIMHMKNLKFFPLVKVSHMYYHLLVKLARQSRQVVDFNEAVQQLILMNQKPKNTATKAQLQLCVISVLQPNIILGTFNDYTGIKRNKNENWYEICQTLGQLFKNIIDDDVKTLQQQKLLFSLQVIGMYLLGHYKDIQQITSATNQKIFKDFNLIDQSLNNKKNYSTFALQLQQVKNEYTQNKQNIINKLFNSIQNVSQENPKIIDEFIESLNL